LWGSETFTKVTQTVPKVISFFKYKPDHPFTLGKGCDSRSLRDPEFQLATTKYIKDKQTLPKKKKQASGELKGRGKGT
jgi:hypothetical protein